MWFADILKGMLGKVASGVKAAKSGASKVANSLPAQGVKKGAHWLGDRPMLQAALEETPDLAMMYTDFDESDGADIFRTALRADALRRIMISRYRNGRALKEMLDKEGKTIQKGYKPGESRQEMIKRAFKDDEKEFIKYADSQANQSFGGKALLFGGGTFVTKGVQSQLKGSAVIPKTEDSIYNELVGAGAPANDDSIMKAKLKYYANRGKELQDAATSRSIAQYLSSDSTINTPLGSVGIGSVVPLWKSRNYKDEVYSKDDPRMQFAQHVAGLMSNKPHFARGVKLDFGSMSSEEAGMYDYIFKNMSAKDLKNVGRQLQLDGDTETYNELKNAGYFD